MQIQVDFPSIFNTALPKVYIKKVTLLPNTTPGSRNGVSYDLESDDGLQKNKYGKKKPKKISPRFRDVSPAGRSLEIKTEVTIKERIKQDGDTTWYNNSEFNEFLNLKIVLARTQDAIENLEDGNFTPKYLKKLKRRSQVIEKNISLRKNETPILDQKVESIDGKKVYSTTYEVTFEIPSYRPRNLSVFAATFVDLREYYLHKSPGVKSSRRFFQGTAVSQRVIKAGEVPTGSSIYLLPDKKLWAGPIHYHEPSGFMAGAFHGPQAHPRLEKRKVPNLVVRDFRVLEDIKQSDFLLRPEKKRLNKKLENKRAKGNRIIKKNLYITEPEYAFNEINQLRFIFHLDMYKVIAEKSQFGACFRRADASAKRRIMNNTRIKNLFVLRSRVKQGLSKNEVVTLNDLEQQSLVAQSGESKRNVVQPRRTKKSLNPALEDSEKVVTGGIREIKLGVEGSEGIRTFTVSDFDMSKRTDGLYSYSVDFEIQDGTAIFVNDQRNKLTQAIGTLTEYYGVASRAENTNKTTGLFTEDFIKEMEEIYKIPEFRDVNVPNRRRRRRAVQSSIAKAPWLNAIAVYSDVMRNLTNARQSDIVRASLLLHSLVEPSSGSVTGIEKMLEMLQLAQSKLSFAAIGGKNRSGTPLSKTNIPMIDEVDYNAKTSAFKGKLSKSAIRLTKKFKTVHDSNIQNFVGYDFLNLQRSKNLGLRVITTDQLSQRLSLENQKYFSRNAAAEVLQPPVGDSQTPEDFTRFINLEDAYYSYLTPAVVYHGKKRLKLVGRGRRLWNVSQYDSMITNLVNSSKERDSLSSKKKEVFRGPKTTPYIPSLSPIEYRADYRPNKAKVNMDTYETNVVNASLISKYGVTLTTKKTENIFTIAEDNYYGLEERERKNLRSKKYLGESTLFTNDFLANKFAKMPIDDNQLRDFTSVSTLFVKSNIQSTDGGLSNKKKKTIKLFRPSDERNIIDKELEKYDDKKNPQAKKQRFISKIPNQIKSIFMGDDPRTNKNWFTVLENKGFDLISSSQYTGLYYFNYNHINQIEVLVGFEKDRNENIQASAPIYRMLTKEVFDRISDAGRPFVCRLRPATIPYFGKSRKLSLPEYNTTFILSSRTNQRDLTADAELVELQDESGEDFDFETPEESIFISRLTEYEDLDTTGRRVLRRLIRRNTRLSGLLPEFTSNTFIQQPRRISRTGATFGIETDQTQGQAQSGVVSEAVATGQRTRTPRAPTGATSTTTPARAQSTTTASPNSPATMSSPSTTPSGGGY
tara:strand:- start:2541 stop:6314 length:3774 start_codon:yes stop_codon:yes gene_type:complete